MHTGQTESRYLYKLIGAVLILSTSVLAGYAIERGYLTGLSRIFSAGTMRRLLLLIIVIETMVYIRVHAEIRILQNQEVHHQPVRIKVFRSGILPLWPVLFILLLYQIMESLFYGVELGILPFRITDVLMRLDFIGIWLYGLWCIYADARIKKALKGNGMPQ